MDQPNQEILQQQIVELQQQLDVARSQNGQDANAPYERSEVHAAVGRKIAEASPSQQTTTPTVSVTPAVGSDLPSYQDPALASQVQALVNTAFTDSVQAAIGQAVKTGNAALIDALHDVLTDQMHEELLKRQKIESAV